ncbi:MAG: alpha/beta fold hydrolase, partial [Miltoncostaeaceae bacterium]
PEGEPSSPDPAVPGMEEIDPLGFGEAWSRTVASLMENPEGVTRAWTRYLTDMTAATAAMTARAGGGEAEGPIAPGRRDRRFRDPAWEQNPALFGMLQAYLLTGRLGEDLMGEADVDETMEHRMAFLAEMVMDAMAPTNNPALNPVVVKRAVETGGASLLKGFQTFLDDMANNTGLPRQIQPDAFTVGKDLALTPGKVVYRNDMMELIQYAPQTDEVHATPLLMSPPWINKYYIMDLAPQRSFIEWAVQHGHTVFAISYRNPDATHAHWTLDDYLVNGPIQALDVMRDITGAERANLVGLCLGGTLTAALRGHLAAKGDDRIASTTLLNTLVDFTRPGRLGAFTDRASVERMEKRMRERGYLDAAEMMGIFTFMRSNDLVWNYAVNNWLLGEEPAPFDILSWNGDSTRMPAEMHSFYLRSCYLGNEIARGVMELAGTRIDPAAITGDFYVLGAQEDHIAPWQGSYMTTQVLPNATHRYVLSAAGHIAGIVNPPSPKAWFRTGDEYPADPEQWMASSTKHEGSWWEDWTEWIGQRSGEMVTPPKMGNRKHKVLADAPGSYVQEA